MYAQCPHCETLFKLRSSELTAADARVRCGMCYTVFNALENLRVPSDEEIIMETNKVVAEHKNVAAVARAPEEQAVPHSLQDDLENLHAPRIRIKKYSTRSTMLIFTGSLLLILMLVVQFLYFDRQRLMRYPEMQPVISGLCGALGCEVPVVRDTKQIDLLSRQLYTHPNAESALMINGSMVNNAPYAQPYPIVELSLSDEQGKIVAARRFKPMEYLAIDEDPLDMMTPGSPVSITLEIADPGEHALAYEFTFL